MRFRRSRQKVDAAKARDPRAVRLAAVALLARRDFASTELIAKLGSQGYDGQLVAEAVAELVAGRIVNDVRYAENYVTYHGDRGEGPKRIHLELSARGLADDLIAAALEAGPDWRARAREVRIRRFGLAAPKTPLEKARQARFLQYRGFSSDHVRSALDIDFDLNE